MDQKLVVNKTADDLKDLFQFVHSSSNEFQKDWASDECDLHLGLARYVIRKAQRNLHARPAPPLSKALCPKPP